MIVYLDNAATSKIKPKEVFQAIDKYYHEINCNPGRGAYELSLEAGRRIMDARARLVSFFGGEKQHEVIFTQNITVALNIALKGLLKEGDHVLITGLEHNGVVRPLRALEKEKGITFSVMPSDDQGRIDLLKTEKLIKSNTKMIMATHASNIVGTIIPIQELGNLAKKHGLDFVVDTAQTAGLLPLNIKEIGATVLAFTGHKHLLGPMGIGGFCMDRKDASRLKPLYEGGTGSISDSEEQPDFLPDRFEPGTQNTLGIVGLGAAVKYLEDIGVQNIRQREKTLTARLLKGLKEIPSVRIYGPKNPKEQTGTIAINFKEIDNAELSFILDKKYKIATRPGLHCAPLAHKTIGTFPEGVLRISLGHFTTEEEIDYCLTCLNEIARSS